MNLKWMTFGIAMFWWIAAPSLLGQDFLKQLEERILKKQADAKSKSDIAVPSSTTPPKTTASEEDLPGPKSNPPLLLTPPEPAPTDEEALPAPKSPSSRNTEAARPRPGSGVFPQVAGTVPSQKKAVGGGYLGMELESITGGGFGLTVASVTPNSPAFKAGFRQGDKLIGVEGAAVSGVDGFAAQLSQYPAGSPVRFLIERNGRSMSLTAVLMERSLAKRIHGNVPGTEPSLPPSTEPGQAYFGINVSDLSDAFRKQFGIAAYRGASVTEVIDGSPAQQSGLKPGDCIIAFRGREIRSAEDILDAILTASPGELVEISFFRGSSLQKSDAILVRADLMGSSAVSNIPKEMLTAEYVQYLQSELDRVTNELRANQELVQQLEARLQQAENRR
jgi:hypothetical protein